VYYELRVPRRWGFCAPGEAERLVERETGPTGKLPISERSFQSFGEATTAMGFQVPNHLAAPQRRRRETVRREGRPRADHRARRQRDRRRAEE
jgi:hypothetical protein